MLKQCFYICNPENEENKIQAKLIRAYINSFCINEEDQTELVVSNYQWKEIFDLEPVQLGLFEALKKCFGLKMISNFHQIFSLLVAFQKIFGYEIAKRTKYRSHFIFGLGFEITKI